MILIKNYHFILQDNDYYIVTRERHVCPNCHGPLRPRDFKRRTAINSNGEVRTYCLRRLKCRCCGATHMELPDFFVPHKHYTRQVIELAIQNSDSFCPAENSTIQRWKQEFVGR